MRVLALMALLAACIPPLAQAKIYKWVMPDGSIQYSDRPQEEGGKPVDLPPLQIYSAPPTPAPGQAGGSDAPGAAKAAEGYDSLKFLTPTPDEVIRDDGAGTVDVRLKIEPGLRRADTVEIFLDGKSISSGRTTNLNVTNVDRGSHTLSAVVKDESGKTVAQAEGVTFHLKKVSVLLPAKPNRPQPRPPIAPVPTPPIANPPAPQPRAQQ